jgi:uncharacterized phage-associated protein
MFCIEGRIIYLWDMYFNIDIDKSIEASLYILNKLESCDIHKLFKILYFSEKNHLADYGRPITGDYYVAMKNGPVPSFIYDVVKYVRGDKSYLSIDRDVLSDFDVVEGMYIGAKREANIEFLCDSDIECLDRAIRENKDLSFHQLTKNAHDYVWDKANANGEINPLDIASAAGANIEMLKYIQINIENQHTFHASSR